jgi:hypothetical protein
VTTLLPASEEVPAMSRAPFTGVSFAAGGVLRTPLRHRTKSTG